MSTSPSRPSSLLESIAGCTSWQQTQSNWRHFSEKQKGDLFEDFVHAYLRLAPEYTSKLKHVWHHTEVPAKVRMALNLPTKDMGIDLVAETKDGEFWAIQCKYRQTTNQSLTYEELSTFSSLRKDVCRGFSFGLVCSTTERFTRIFQNTDDIAFAALDVWLDLPPSFFDSVRNSLVGKTTSEPPRKPRPHQQAAVQDGIAHFIKGKETRGKLIMPCGTGKSLTAWFLAQALKSKRIVIAVPSLSLIRQTLKDWLRETAAHGIQANWICVCSDNTAGKTDNDDTAVHRQDLGIECHTNPDRIADWLRKKRTGLTVVFTTYQSGSTLSEGARAAGFEFDLGILDEAHKTVGDGDKLFSHLLHEENIAIKRRVFMTATERRYSGKSDNVLSMHDPAVYGDTFHLLSFRKAMECDPPILSDYKIITMLVSRNEVAELVRKNSFVRPDHKHWNEEVEADMLASVIALRKAMQLYPIRHAVSFHSSIQRAEWFVDHNKSFTSTFHEYGDLDTFHVSGRASTGERSRTITDFANSERGLITNARCLTEGVDVPKIDCVLFADPRQSKIDIVQAVGRALRPLNGKKAGYVILPVLEDADTASVELSATGAFKTVISTLRALAANDDRIIEEFRDKAEGRQRKESSIVEFPINENLALRINLGEFVHGIELKVWDRLAQLAWRPFHQAREFARALDVRSAGKWADFVKVKSLPADIPLAPQLVYRFCGWLGWGDWLGTGSIATRETHYLTYHDARNFVHSLGLKREIDWKQFKDGKLPEKGILPSNIPKRPQGVYENSGWGGWADWLGNGRRRKVSSVARKFHEAREYARSIRLRGIIEWKNFCKGELPEKGLIPLDIPTCPDSVYRNEGWKGWDDWLGNNYRYFSEARTFARSLDLKSQGEWGQFCKGNFPEKGRLPSDIPSAPQQVYANEGWSGYGDWLGTGRVASHLKSYRPFAQARDFARGLGLKSWSEWIQFCQGKLPEKGSLPSDIPKDSRRSYADKGWISIGDWLGTGRIADHLKAYRSFDEARSFARSLGLKNGSEWRIFCKGGMPERGKLPSDIPAKPANTYAKKGWTSLGDWLGTGAVLNRDRVYRNFSEARAFALELGIKCVLEWRSYCKGALPDKGTLPLDIPATPEKVYANAGWNGWGNWLGTGSVATRSMQYRKFDDAQDFVRTLGLKNNGEWRNFCKGILSEKGTLPGDIPASPSHVYASKGWSGWADWLGTDTKRRNK